MMTKKSEKQTHTNKCKVKADAPKRASTLPICRLDKGPKIVQLLGLLERNWINAQFNLDTRHLFLQQKTSIALDSLRCGDVHRLPKQEKIALKNANKYWLTARQMAVATIPFCKKQSLSTIKLRETKLLNCVL